MAKRSIVAGSLAVALLLAASIYSLTKGTARHLSIGRFNVLDSESDGLWFAPNGSLVALSHQQGLVIVKIWRSDSYNHPPREFSLQFAKKAGLDPIYSLRPDPSSKSEYIPYDISSDVRSVAWAQGRFLYAQDIQAAASGIIPDPIDLGREIQVESLSFTGDDQVSLMLASGSLETWGIPERKVRIEGIPFAHWRIWTTGPFMALSAFDSSTGDVGLIRFSPKTFIKKYEVNLLSGFRNGTSLAFSPASGLAVGTNEGSIFAISSGSDVRPFQLKNSKPVNAMAFYDAKHLIVAGDFPGIILVDLSSDKDYLQEWSTPVVRQLATKRGYIACSTLHQTMIASIGPAWRLTDEAKDLWKIVFWLIGLMGFILALLRDRKNSGFG